MIGAEPVIEKRRWLSPVWLLPLIALLLAGGFLYQQIASRGQLIQINFAQGNGILPGKTQIRYQGVAVGVVQELELAEDGRKIAVMAKIESSARSLIRKGSDFWLVSRRRPLPRSRASIPWSPATTSTCNRGVRATRLKIPSMLWKALPRGIRRRGACCT